MIDMRSKKELEKELIEMREQLKMLNNRETDIKGLLNEKIRSEEVGSNILQLFKYVMDENKKNNIILKSLTEKLERIEATTGADYYEQGDQSLLPQENKLAKVQPISGLDAQIMQIIQTSRNCMACADDIKKHMNYKGRNAASARLNRLYSMGLLERYQLGHKVYYKYDAAGKSTDTLIVSPPQ